MTAIRKSFSLDGLKFQPKTEHYEAMKLFFDENSKIAKNVKNKKETKSFLQKDCDFISNWFPDHADFLNQKNPHAPTTNATILRDDLYLKIFDSKDY